MNREALIIINGQSLTQGQSMTMRVALEMFAMDLNSGDIKDIERGYLSRIKEIRKILYSDYQIETPSEEGAGK